MWKEKVNELMERLGVGWSVANELLILTGGDIDMAEEASRKSFGLDQAKANAIDARFRKLEQ